MSQRSLKRSTMRPLPSSPHCAPMHTTFVTASPSLVAMFVVLHARLVNAGLLAARAVVVRMARENILEVRLRVLVARVRCGLELFLRVRQILLCELDASKLVVRLG